MESIRDKKYPYDPEMIAVSADIGRKFGQKLLERSLANFDSQDLYEICRLNNVDVTKLDAQFVYNWVFQGVADVLRNQETREEIAQLVEGAKENS